MTKKRWTPDDVREMLTNPVYAGVGPYPAIVEEETWLKCNVHLIEETGTSDVVESILAQFQKVFPGLDVPDAEEYTQQAAEEAKTALHCLLIDLRARVEVAT